MKLTTQRRMAKELLNCGSERVWFDPAQLERISQAVTREDIRKLIDSGVISKHQKQGVSRVRAKVIAKQKRKGLRKGPGKRKGTANARLGKKSKWMLKIRALRKLLKGLRKEGTVDRSTYRKLYLKSKGNAYRDKGHLMTNLESERQTSKKGEKS